MFPQFGGIGIEASTNWRIATTHDSIRFTSTACAESLSYSGFCKYARSWARRSWYSSSLAEPIAICRNRPISTLPFLQQPSAIFIPTDAEDRLIDLSGRTFLPEETLCSTYKYPESACAPSPRLEDCENSARPLRF